MVQVSKGTAEHIPVQILKNTEQIARRNFALFVHPNFYPFVCFPIPVGGLPLKVPVRTYALVRVFRGKVSTPLHRYCLHRQPLGESGFGRRQPHSRPTAYQGCFCPVVPSPCQHRQSFTQGFPQDSEVWGARTTAVGNVTEGLGSRSPGATCQWFAAFACVLPFCGNWGWLGTVAHGQGRPVPASVPSRCKPWFGGGGGAMAPFCVCHWRVVGGDQWSVSID